MILVFVFKYCKKLTGKYEDILDDKKDQCICSNDWRLNGFHTSISV